VISVLTSNLESLNQSKRGLVSVVVASGADPNILIFVSPYLAVSRH